MRHLSAALLLLLALPASAHPLPNQRFDRTVDVRLAPAGVVVTYTLDMNEWTMVLDGKKILSDADLAKVTGLRDYAPIYAGRKGVLLADNLRATIDGQPVTFKVEKIDPTPEKDHLRFRFTLRGDRAVPAGTKVAFAFDDQNFEAESGKLSLSLHLDPAFTVHDLDEPGGLRGKSPLELRPGEAVKMRKCSAVVELPTKEAGGGRQPPVATPPPVTTESQQGADAPRSPPDQPGFLADLFDRGLVALFDSKYGLGILLLAAGLFGMGHAFTPGHGKTLVAAYLVGEKGTIRHAFVLGFTTTVAHTGSVIAVAAVLAYLYRDGVPSTAQGWLQLAGGALIFLVGLWLLARRLQGKADHVHIGGSGHHHHGPGGHHHHGPDCDHTHDDHHHHSHGTGFGWGRVILLGIGGGLIPCWDAVMLLFVAISAGRLALAVPLLLAFSVGLAAVLVALGVGVVLAHRAGAGRFGEQRWFKALPIVSSALLVGMGLWLARDGVQRLIAADKATAAEVRE